MRGASSRFSSLSRARFRSPSRKRIDPVVDSRASSRRVEQDMAMTVSMRLNPFSAGNNGLPLNAVPLLYDPQQRAQIGVKNQGSSAAFPAGTKPGGPAPEQESGLAPGSRLLVYGPGQRGAVVDRQKARCQNGTGKHNLEKGESLEARPALAARTFPETRTGPSPVGAHSRDHRILPETATTTRMAPASFAMPMVPAGAAVPRLWKVIGRDGTATKPTPGGRGVQVAGSRSGLPRENLAEDGSTRSRMSVFRLMAMERARPAAPNSDSEAAWSRNSLTTRPIPTALQPAIVAKRAVVTANSRSV